MKTRMFKGLWLTSIAAVALAGTACSSGGGKKAEEQGSVKPAEPVEIVFYNQASNMNEEQFDVKYGAMLRKKFPTYTFKYIPVKKELSMQDLIMSGTKFDIYFSTIGNFESAMFANSLQVDMTDLIKKHNLNLGIFDPTIIDAVRQASGGKLYGIPVDTNTFVLFYNKALFDKFAVSYPTDNMTWEQISDLSKKLTRVDNGVQIYGYSTSAAHMLRLNQLSISDADLKTNTPTINKDDKWKRLIESAILSPVSSYADLFKSGALKVLPGHQTEFLKTQTLAMYAYQLTLLSTYAPQMKEMSWDLVSLPTFKEAPNVGPQTYPAYWGITKMARNPDAAMEVLKYMVSEEYQREMGRQGNLTVLNSQTVKDAFIKESEFKDHNLQAVFRNKNAPIPAKAEYDAELITIYTNAVQQEMLNKGTDMNTALRLAEEQSVKKIAELTKK
ncbi:MAG: extracellular solute-binding protein family 1 [Paenibacillus sp.]|nr:extracellular solute-binding protein family 1 [Paenibacillus sp.]